MDDELRALRRRFEQEPGDDLAARLVSAALRAGGPLEAVAAFGAVLAADEARCSPAREAALAELARRAGPEVGRFLAAGPLDQAEACLRGLVRGGALAPVVALARRVGALRSLSAARALVPSLPAPLVAAGLPTPPALLALAEFEAYDDMICAELPQGIGPPARATGPELLEEHLRLRALHDLLGTARQPVEPTYMEALRQELATELARGAPRAGWSDWKSMSLHLVVELEPHAVGALPWLEALRFLTPSAAWWQWDAEQEAARLAALLAQDETGGGSPA